MTDKKTVILLLGPTATGKTGLSIELATHYPLEIINADSTLVYKGMDIGTAKPSMEERAGVPHHLIDINTPAEPYSAGQFCEDALRLIPEIHARGNIPCLVGGTMLYLHYLEKGFVGMPESDPQLREAIEQEGAEKGWPAMWAQLQEHNPARASQLHPNDRQRVARALELLAIEKQTPGSIQQKNTQLEDHYHVHRICLHAKDRKKLHAKIEQRFHSMLNHGFLDEAKELFDNPDNKPSLPALKTVGYRQAHEFLTGQCNYNEFIDKAIAATRQLAKRQHTWLNKWPDVPRFDCEDDEAILSATLARLDDLKFHH